jgi:hypothetical protein
MTLRSPCFAGLFALATALLSPLAVAGESGAPSFRWSIRTAPGEEDLEGAALEAAPEDGTHDPVASLLEPEERRERELVPYADEWVLVSSADVALLRTARWSVDVEARCLSEVTEGTWATTSFLAGPRVTLHTAGWRAQVSVLPALLAPREVEVERAAPTASSDERAVVRLLVGTDL